MDIIRKIMEGDKVKVIIYSDSLFMCCLVFMLM